MHRGRVKTVCFSLDGKLLVSCSNDKTTRIWEVSSWKVINVLKSCLYSIWKVCLHNNGLFIASASLDKNIRIWQIGK